MLNIKTINAYVNKNATDLTGCFLDLSHSILVA